MDQTDGQGQGEITALGLVEQASREASANGMQLHLRDGALEAKKKPPVRGARIVNAVAIADEGLAIAAQIQQRIPIRAVPAETGHFGREHDADLAQCHTGDQVLEALPMGRRRPAQAEISVDDHDIRLAPAEIESTPAQIVLQPQALLIGEPLMRARLPDVAERPAPTVARVDEFRSHVLPPRGWWQTRQRGRAAPP